MLEKQQAELDDKNKTIRTLKEKKQVLAAEIAPDLPDKTISMSKYSGKWRIVIVVVINIKIDNIVDKIDQIQSKLNILFHENHNIMREMEWPICSDYLKVNRIISQHL